jgi:two-component system, OmpR family, sensor histidine kinase KdpD
MHTLSKHRWPSWLMWALAWGLMFVLDETVSLGSMALLLVLASALAALWSSASASLISSILSVVLFNVLFVPPKFTFHVYFLQDYFLLITMLGVSVVVSSLMLRLRRAAEQERMHAMQAEQLRTLSEQLRENQDMLADAQLLLGLMTAWGFPDASLQWNAQEPSPISETPILAIRGKSQQFGFVQLGHHMQVRTGLTAESYTTAHLQALCDLFGLELERQQAIRSANTANEEAQSQKLRNTLLTAIAHDYRTPLANLMGAASVIHDQGARLSPTRVGELSHTILDEAQQLNRMTSNTLQLARLDASSLDVRKDWESMQELVGSVIQKSKQRFGAAHFHIHISPHLPLVYCDAILVVQLLENLIENAVKYSPATTRIDIEVTQPLSEQVRVCVRDQGPGISDAWKERVFDAFARVDTSPLAVESHGDHTTRRGVGLGLAVCRAIARVHDAKIWIEDAVLGGTAVCVTFPVRHQPEVADVMMGDTVCN